MRHALLLVLLGGCATHEAPGHAPIKAPPAGAIGGFQANLPEVTVPAGGEVWPCFLIPIELEGDSRMVGGGTASFGPGVHHGNILTRKKSGEGIRECPSDAMSMGNEVLDVIEGGSLLFGSSTQAQSNEWLSFPAGTAFRLAEGYEIVARMHYVNAGRQPLTIAPRYQWYTVPEASVTQEVAPFLWIYRPFSLPPQQKTTIQSTCALPRPMHVVAALPHTHGLGINVEAAHVGGPQDGTVFLESPGYDPDNGTWVQYDTPVDLSQGTGVRFSCTFDNTSDRVVDEGPAGSDEMCMIGGFAFPPENSFSGIAIAPDTCSPIAAHGFM